MAGFSSSSDDEMISGINVTPLVDVVLVLLVIFLITAPVIYQSAIKVQLPKARSGEQQQKSPLNFTITREGSLSLDKETVSWDALPGKLTALVHGSGDPSGLTALISADAATPHGTVIRLMDALRQSGLMRFALNVENAPAR
jgi:biopolymer transport protein ExbD